MLIDDIMKSLKNMDHIERLRKEHPGFDVLEWPDGTILIAAHIEKDEDIGNERKDIEYPSE